MDYWLDHVLTGVTLAVIAGGVLYAVAIFPFGPQSVWADQVNVSKSEQRKMTECLLVYDDISNGRVQDLDLGHARDCKKQIGEQKR